MHSVKIKKPGISDKCVELVVLPVSGGHFINQVALITLLCDNGFKPEIVLGSSGGVVSAYVGLCGDWKTNGIMRVMDDMCSNIFVSSWWGKNMSFMPSGVIGIFKGAIYNHGKGSYELISSYLNSDSITRCEIWAGSYNKDSDIATMFCNKSKETSYIKYNREIQSMPVKIEYLNGDVKKITTSIYASSSIPALLPPIEIDGCNYYDGGLLNASPLMPLSDYLPNCLKIIYISSFDMEKGKADLVDCSNIIKIGIGSVDKTVTGLCIADRIFALRLVMKCSEMKYRYLSDIKEALRIYKKSEKAVLELFPTEDLEVNITDFDCKNSIPIIQKIRHNYGIRLWWEN